MGATAALASQLVFVATAAGAAPTQLGGVRSAMARAAQLLELDRPPAPLRTAIERSTASRSRPAGRRTRRYAERQSSLAVPA